MLKKVMTMLASKYLAIKGRIRAIETHLIIQSLLLRDKKMIRHLFRQRNLSNKVKDEENDCHQSENDSVATTPLIAQEAELMDNDDDDDDYTDEEKEDESVSVIEMVKNAKEGRGKKFVLEDDIDKVADLFIQRFHHQIRLQKRLYD